MIQASVCEDSFDVKHVAMVFPFSKFYFINTTLNNNVSEDDTKYLLITKIYVYILLEL